MSVRPARVLYVQHAGAVGGSAVSLRNTIEGLDRGRFEPIVALARPSHDLARFYASCQCLTLPWPGLVTLEHTTAHWCSVYQPACWRHQVQLALGWRRTAEKTRALVDRTRPDIVHLNSVVLYPSARVLGRLSVPFVWHVREHPVDGHLGLRRGLLSRALQDCLGEVIFLSDADRDSWVEGRRGVVVENYVDLRTFPARTQEARAEARTQLGLAETDFVIAFLGGLVEIKGIFVLLQALGQLRAAIPNLKCLMPGGAYAPHLGRIVRIARNALAQLGVSPVGERAQSMIRDLSLADICVRLPLHDEVAPLLMASDLLVFPATQAHFARPVIEAAAAGLPVVASDLPGVRSLVVDGETGVLTPAGDPAELARRIEELYLSPTARRRFGSAARAVAEQRFDVRRGLERIMTIYDRLLASRG